MVRLLNALPLLLLLSACAASDPCEDFDFPLAPPTPQPHVSSCLSSECGNGLNPPNGGPHCSATLSCRTYAAEQPRCQWLHNLEHGHLVLLYNCPEGCAEEVAKLEAALQSVKTGGNGVRRALMAPDSRLPQRVAALLWRRSYVADSVDPQALQCLLRHQDDRTVTPEPELPCAP
jgi:Protein of unknown function (DUF3105)